MKGARGGPASSSGSQYLSLRGDDAPPHSPSPPRGYVPAVFPFAYSEDDDSDADLQNEPTALRAHPAATTWWPRFAGGHAQRQQPQSEYLTLIPLSGETLPTADPVAGPTELWTCM